MKKNNFLGEYNLVHDENRLGIHHGNLEMYEHYHIMPEDRLRLFQMYLDKHDKIYDMNDEIVEQLEKALLRELKMINGELE